VCVCMYVYNTREKKVDEMLTKRSNL